MELLFRNAAAPAGGVLLSLMLRLFGALFGLGVSLLFFGRLDLVLPILFGRLSLILTRSSTLVLFRLRGFGSRFRRFRLILLILGTNESGAAEQKRQSCCAH